MGRWGDGIGDAGHELIEVHCHHLLLDPADARILKDALDEVMHALDARLKQVQLLLGLPGIVVQR